MVHGLKFDIASQLRRGQRHMEGSTNEGKDLRKITERKNPCSSGSHSETGKYLAPRRRITKSLKEDAQDPWRLCQVATTTLSTPQHNR